MIDECKTKNDLFKKFVSVFLILFVTLMGLLLEAREPNSSKTYDRRTEDDMDDSLSWIDSGENEDPNQRPVDDESTFDQLPQDRSQSSAARARAGRQKNKNSRGRRLRRPANEEVEISSASLRPRPSRVGIVKGFYGNGSATQLLGFMWGYSHEKPLTTGFGFNVSYHLFEKSVTALRFDGLINYPYDPLTVFVGGLNLTQLSGNFGGNAQPGLGYQLGVSIKLDREWNFLTDYHKMTSSVFGAGTSNAQLEITGIEFAFLRTY